MMANFKIYFPIENRLEGTVFENDPNDQATHFGLIVDDLIEYNLDVTGDGKIDWKDVRDLKADQAALILKKVYWDYMKADSINNQSLAMYIVDSGLVFGRPLVSKFIQSILGLVVDGLFGPKTINAINMLNDGKVLHDALKSKIISRCDAIVKANPHKKEYYNGWINRINAIKYAP